MNKSTLLRCTFMLCFFSVSVKSQIKSASEIKVQVYTTAKEGNLRLTRTPDIILKTARQPVETEQTIIIDPEHQFQSVIGIGGALTDASAEVFYKLPVDKQQELLKAYYDPENGIGYNLARTNIQSCDFSSDVYSYTVPNDPLLKSFNIGHDLKYRIPLIKAAIKESGGRLNIFASPWSPPAWMKDNNDVLHGGKLKPEYRQSWANFFVKFINEYQRAGVPIWGLTVQNEPLASQKWESCVYTAEEQRDFVKNNLGPALAKAGMSSKKLMVWDHNRDLIFQQASVILDDPEAAKYIWGVAYHWYETWTGSKMQFQNLKLVSEAFPGKKLFFSEGCNDKFDPQKINDWGHGEKYGMSMINDFNNNTVAWTDWNILLDENGGPNHVQNFCFAPVHADTRTGKLTFTSAYYYIGQLSKFVHAGAKRVSCSSTSDKLLSTGFLNPDGQLVIVVMNEGEEQVIYNLYIKGKASAVNCPAHSISTFLIHSKSL